MGKKKTNGGDMGSDAQEGGGGGLLRPQAFEVAELLKDPANVRKHSDRNVEAIAASLRRFGQQKPIVVDVSGVVRAGNGTLEAAQRLGWEKIVGVVTDLKGGDATAYAIADNRTAELAEWDDDALQSQLLGLMDEDQELAFAAGWVEMKNRSSKHRKIKPEVWLRECEKLFDVTRSVGYRIWGIATQAAPRAVYPYKPFLFRSYVTASFMGICNESGIRFDESFPVKEDYEMNLRCVNEDGGIIAARHIYWSNSHWFDDGGCKEYRTSVMELDCIQRLQEKYPGQVQRIDRGGVDVSIELKF